MTGLSEEFSGTARFAVREKLGSGGMGVVYHAYDRKLGLDVALKTLKNLDAASLYHFKREFRALADVSHPNLVQLYELISEGHLWFFTLELVRGSTFFEYVSAPDGLRRALSTIDFKDRSSFAKVFASQLDEEAAPLVEGEENTEVLPTLRHGAEESTRSTGNSLRPDASALAGGSAPSFKRLREALQQLTQGLLALHGSGKLHRDLKPSNVLVTRAGRVVILDFGLIADLEGRGSQFLTSSNQGLAGTFAYMAPEQGGSEPLTPAADWYAVGVMLYEALTGQLPFLETGIDVLLKKQRVEPPPPASLMGGIPPDLNELCIDLLRRDPLARPTGQDIWRRLCAPSDSTSVGLRVPKGLITEEQAFIGRTKHLAALETGFGVARSEGAVAMVVRGGSGIGKTTLIRRFLEALHTQEDAVILTGRCYERESVPYKAVDSLVDALSRYLAKVPKNELQGLLPRNVAALARIFPVLNRIPLVSRAHRLPALTPDEQELRRRAFGAFRELLSRISEQLPVVLFVDDLQWGDVDSAHLLAELLRPPDAPRLLFIGCYRAEDEAASPMLQEIARQRLQIPNFRTLTIGALSSDEAMDLALTLLGGDPDQDLRMAQTIARESSGNPFFIDTLAQRAKVARRSRRETPSSLNEVLMESLQELPEPTRNLLEIIAVAGRPIRREVAAWAAHLSAADESAAFDQLRALRFIRTSVSEDERALECYHDRIRQAVLARVPRATLLEHQAALAEAFQERQPDDVEAVFHHSFEAGNMAVAGDFAERSGDHAREVLAFGRAAALYQIALDLLPSKKDSQRPPLLEKLGDALASGGRGPEAAARYLDAAGSATGLEQLDLMRRAGLQLLIGGQVEAGLSALSEVLDRLGVRLPKTGAGVMATQAYAHVQLRSKGLSFEPRPETECSKEDLLRVDTLHTVSSGIGFIDPAFGTEVQTRHLLAALKLGEPIRAARAIALSAGYAGAEGGKAKDRAYELRREAQKLAEVVDDARLEAFETMTEGFVDYLSGEWVKARQNLEQAERDLGAHAVGATWELASTRWILNAALYYLGELKTLTQRVTAALDDADLRGAMFESTSLRLGHASTIFLMRDNPERALRVVEETIGRWTQKTFLLQHHLARTSLAQTHVYMGRSEKALGVLDDSWPALRDSKMMHSQYLRIDAGFLRSRVLLACAVQARKHQAAYLAESLRFAEKIGVEKVRWVRPLVDLVRAGVTSFDDPKGTRANLEAALSGFEACNMGLYAHAARYRLGGIIGGEDGFNLQRIAFAYFTGEGVRNVGRFLATFAPGRYE